MATGFWVLSKGEKLFITNRHSLDLSMKYKKNTYKLTKTEIELRTKIGGKFEFETRFFEVKSPSLLFGLNTDLAIIVDPKFCRFPGVFGHLNLELPFWE